MALHIPRNDRSDDRVGGEADWKPGISIMEIPGARGHLLGSTPSRLYSVGNKYKFRVTVFPRRKSAIPNAEKADFPSKYSFYGFRPAERGPEGPTQGYGSNPHPWRAPGFRRNPLAKRETGPIIEWYSD